MILEIRHYTLKPGLRDAFIEVFESQNRRALRDAGMLVFGPLRDLENADKVHWMRAFPTLEERDRIKEGFYSGPVWNKQLEPLVMPMIDHYEAELTQTTARFEGFGGTSAL